MFLPIGNGTDISSMMITEKGKEKTQWLVAINPVENLKHDSWKKKKVLKKMS